MPARVRTVLLDEVQRVPALCDVVQVLLDATSRWFRFLLFGSSARKLRPGQANSLPGCTILRRVRLAHARLTPDRLASSGFVPDRSASDKSLPDRLRLLRRR